MQTLAVYSGPESHPGPHTPENERQDMYENNDLTALLLPVYMLLGHFTAHYIHREKHMPLCTAHVNTQIKLLTNTSLSMNMKVVQCPLWHGHLRLEVIVKQFCMHGCLVVCTRILSSCTSHAHT